MRTFILCTLSIFILGTSLPAQTLKTIRKQMILIPGGTFAMGGGYQYKVEGFAMKYLGHDPGFEKLNQTYVALGEIPASNNPDRMVTVSDFYLSAKEVTNRQYIDFLLDSLFSPEEADIYWQKVNPRKKDIDSSQFYLKKFKLRAGEAGLLPDTLCWSRDFVFAFNEPLVHYYFLHPAFDQYPVVGVSWLQARAYCDWLTRANNHQLAKEGRPAQAAFRLPTEAEWEYAAQGEEFPTPKGKEVVVRRIYPWPGLRVQSPKGEYYANMKTDHSDYIGDNYEYTSPVGSFPPTPLGLYDMAGNVAEWTEDVFRLNQCDQTKNVKPEYDNVNFPRVVKGGSWAEYRYGAQVGSRTWFPQNEGLSRVGFRVAMIKQ
ncbi:MAG: SUMF1/EgtB/PvdO family nonheme iron enzyme [Bacteroidia bacterium]|nr:SUMF1/EgtB/PvdO family nonheme iron enzyme [Bacteroidia bacterium]